MTAKKKAKGFSLRLGLLGIVAGCWVLPMVLVLSSLVYYTAESVRRQFDETTRATVTNAAISCRRGIREAVEASRGASYDNRIRDARLVYERTGGSQRLYDAVTGYLREKYQYDDNFMSAMVFFRDEPDSVYYTFNPLRGATYANVLEYRNNIHADVIESSRELGTGVAFINRDGGVYMVRNIVDQSFTPYATIVCEMNGETITGGFSGILWMTGATVYLNGTAVNANGNEAQISFAAAPGLPSGGQTVTDDEGVFRVYGRENTDAVDVLYAVEVDMRAFMRGFFSFTHVIYILLILTAPLIFLAVRFFFRNIFKPIGELTGAAGKIQEGELGYEIKDRPKNREFDYLTGAFNDMSARLKSQFERIYSEELALRDAKLMALQAQINPHFLNNTLEIINWELRLNNGDGVAKLIEALATMFDAATDRQNSPLVTLEQEMQYVDAYLYIVSQRFENRLTITKDIDGAALGCMVPRLIMQPIVENAVEHGVEGQPKGNIEISAKLIPGGVRLAVRNDTPMTDENRQLVERLLSPEYVPGGEDAHHVGIRNVNARLKMIFGEDAGLSVTGDADATVSCFTVPFSACSGLSNTAAQ